MTFSQQLKRSVRKYVCSVCRLFETVLKMMTILLLVSVLFVSALAVCLTTTALNITAPQTMEALSGSCLQIPCNFRAKTEKNFTGNNFGVWIKSDSRFENSPKNVIFNGSRTDNVYQVEIIGDLNQKNCTSVFSSLKKNYTDKYFFRVEGQSFTATAGCHPLQINITGKRDCDFQSTNQFLFAQHLSAFIIRTDSLPSSCSSSPRAHAASVHVSIVYQLHCLSTIVHSHCPLPPSGSIINCYLGRGRPPLSDANTIQNTPNWIHQTKQIKLSQKCIKIPNHNFIPLAEHSFITSVLVHNESHLLQENQPPLVFPSEPLRWEPVLGGVAGIVLLICSIIFVWYLKSRHAAVQQTQSQTGEELVITNSATRTEEENIHYSEVEFSRQRAGLSSDSLLDSGQQQDTVYTQVNVFKRGN
ncbi:uncharacterized protein LOC128425544 [Pleuronectes platessa]|uniref:uncharacterized protein LOC128425544 n=1 Tax=Pleuronectes platessa TaxID=8262 RepID=UPI00232A4143|nr:uncharacterized protein LOC128425544 [Pleuronectes platessa]